MRSRWTISGWWQERRYPTRPAHYSCSVLRRACWRWRDVATNNESKPLSENGRLQKGRPFFFGFLRFLGFLGFLRLVPEVPGFLGSLRFELPGTLEAQEPRNLTPGTAGTTGTPGTSGHKPNKLARSLSSSSSIARFRDRHCESARGRPFHRRRSPE